MRALAQLDRRCFKPIDAYAWYEFSEPVRVAGRDHAESDAAAIGSSASSPAIRAVSEGHTIIVTIAVDPDYQRRGIGERLLREVETRSALPRLQLMVRKSNLPALQLYRKLNYAIVETWPRYYEDGEDAYVMEKTPHPVIASSASRAKHIGERQRRSISVAGECSRR